MFLLSPPTVITLMLLMMEEEEGGEEPGQRPSQTKGVGSSGDREVMARRGGGTGEANVYMKMVPL